MQKSDKNINRQRVKSDHYIIKIKGRKKKHWIFILFDTQRTFSQVDEICMMFSFKIQIMKKIGALFLTDGLKRFPKEISAKRNFGYVLILHFARLSSFRNGRIDAELYIYGTFWRLRNFLWNLRGFPIYFLYKSETVT